MPDGTKRDIESILKRIKKLNIPKENKQLIVKFYKECVVSGCKEKTVLCDLKAVYIFAKRVKKHFSKVTKDDILNYFSELKKDGYNHMTLKYKRNGFYSERTIELWKILIKKFFKFIHNSDKYPECVRWLKSNNNYKYKLPEDMLKPDEIEKMIEKTNHPRDVALVSVLYESACRVGELLSLKIKNVKFDNCGGEIFIANSKTKERPIPLFKSVPALRNWLNHHPDKNNPESPLWISLSKRDYGKIVPLEPRGVSYILKSLAKQAGIKKRIYPHLLRHSGLTELSKKFKEQELAIWAGWSKRSRMPEIYIHLTDEDIKNKYYEINGIIRVKEAASRLKSKICVNCKTKNPQSYTFCGMCGTTLVKDAVEAEKLRKQLEENKDKSKEANRWLNILIQDPKVQRFLEKKIEKLVQAQNRKTTN